MLKFIKRFFQKDEVEVVLPKQTVAFDGLSEWLDKHTSKNAKSVAEQTRPILDKNDDAIFAAQENLKKLSHAELKNKGISARELSIMKGNRNSYVRRTQQFLDKLSSLYDKNAITYEDMKLCVQMYKTDVLVLNKALMKPYAVLQHFFANESYAVAQQIKKIDEHMKELDVLLQKESQEAVDDCKKQIVAIEHKRSEKSALEKKKNAGQENLDRVSVMEQQAQQKLAKVEESEGYAKYVALIEEEKEHAKKVEMHGKLLTRSFSVMDKALRKYAKKDSSQQLLIDAYCDNPVAALHKDDSFGIVMLLGKLRGSLDALELKDNKKAKTLAEIEKLLVKDFFVTFLAQDKELFDKKHQLEKNVKNHFSSQQYKEASYMLQTYKEKADTLRGNVAVLSADLEKIDIAAMVTQLEKDLYSCTKFEVEITL